jgi:hypothetical protein
MSVFNKDSFSYGKLLENKRKKLNISSERFSYSYMSKNAESVMDAAKLKDRPYMKLQDWNKLNYYKDDWCQKMLEKYSNVEINLPYLNYDDTTIEEFRNKYEKLNIPVIIKGNTKYWKATNQWRFEVKYIFLIVEEFV